MYNIVYTYIYSIFSPTFCMKGQRFSHTSTYFNLIYIISLKVGPDDVTFLLGTRDSVPMEHCSTLSQGVVSASNNV